MKPKYLHVAIVVLSLVFVVPDVSEAHSYNFVLSWGTFGTGDGEFHYPYDIAIDSSGNFYVADRNNHRIQKFDSDANFSAKWGSYGTGDGEFQYPWGIAVDSSGNVYVADQNNNRIQKFNSSGAFLTEWGSQGSGDGQFNIPFGIAVDSSGNVYVSDISNNRIQKFDSSGAFLVKWGSYGSADGQFQYPWGVAVDSSGNVYVAANHRIQKFDSSGNVYVVDSGNSRIQKFDSSGAFLAKWGSWGIGDGQFRYPYGIEVDSSGDVYVADRANNRIQKFSYGNTQPVADAGPDQTVLVNESAIFDGSLSYDPDGTIVSYNWDFGDAQESGLIVFHTYNTAGTYTITLTVTDDEGASATDQTTIAVLTSAEACEDLIATVESMNLPQGIENSFDVKIEAVQDALVAANAGVREDAVNKLEAFINAVEAQRGKVLTDSQAEQLVNYANRIIAALSEPSASECSVLPQGSVVT